MSTYNEECLQMDELIRIMSKLGTSDEIVQVLPNAFSSLAAHESFLEHEAVLAAQSVRCAWLGGWSFGALDTVVAH